MKHPKALNPHRVAEVLEFALQHLRSLPAREGTDEAVSLPIIQNILEGVIEDARKDAWWERNYGG